MPLPQSPPAATNAVGRPSPSQSPSPSPSPSPSSSPSPSPSGTGAMWAGARQRDQRPTQPPDSRPPNGSCLLGNCIRPCHRPVPWLWGPHDECRFVYCTKMCGYVEWQARAVTRRPGPHPAPPPPHPPADWAGACDGGPGVSGKEEDLGNGRCCRTSPTGPPPKDGSSEGRPWVCPHDHRGGHQWFCPPSHRSVTVPPGSGMSHAFGEAAGVATKPHGGRARGPGARPKVAGGEIP